MKKQFLLVFAFFAAVLFSACSDKGSDESTPAVENVVEVSGEIKANATWSADKIYLLKGFVFVSNNATLTIKPGTIIKGDKASKGTLIVTRGAKIDATGTSDQPIVFTSAQAAGARSQGDWGGIILLGKAPVNQGNDVKIEGGLTAPSGVTDDKPYIYYGGTDAADNSGTLKYVRIEYAGIPFSPDNEINGLTMGGVGNGTTIDYVEVYRSGDDSYEWFGGTVNCKHLLSIASWDDDFDTDFGFSGKVQFALAQRAAAVADVSGSNGFESDNDGSGSNLTPQTSAVFSNVTILGPITKAGESINANFQHAAQIRRNSSISIFNSVFAGYVDGVYIDDSKVVTAKATSTNYTAQRLKFANNLIVGTKNNEVKGENKVDFETTLRAANTFDNTIYADALFTNPYKYSTEFKASGNAQQGTPDFSLKANSIAATGALFADAKLSAGFFDTSVAYKGAFGTTNWASGWAHFDPQNLPYTTPGAVK